MAPKATVLLAMIFLIERESILTCPFWLWFLEPKCSPAFQTAASSCVSNATRVVWGANDFRDFIISKDDQGGLS